MSDQMDDRTDPTAASTEITRYVDQAMFDAQPIAADALDRPRVRLMWATPDPLGAIACTMMAYEGRFPDSLADITDDERREWWEESFKGHLHAPWEFVQFHFILEGATRANTHQVVRQRTATFAQESMRFAVKDNPRESVRPGPSIRGSAGRERVYWEAIDAIWAAYRGLIADGVPAEDARGLLPHDVLTRLNWRTNLSDLDNHMGNRLCTQAQFEWRYIGAAIKQAIREYTDGERFLLDETPATTGWQFELIAESPIFQPVCFKLGHCPWSSKIDRGCTIRPRVDRGEFAAIGVDEWLADPTAGWVRSAEDRPS